MSNKEEATNHAVAKEKIIREDQVLSKEEREIERIKHNVELIEEKRGGKLIFHKDLEEVAPSFSRWLKTIAKYGNVDKTMIIIKHDDHDRYNVCFYTNDNCYSISLTLPNSEKNQRGYLGCVMSERKPLPGLPYTRGNDFPDGPYTEKTWKAIIHKILGYEMKNLQIDLK